MNTKERKGQFVAKEDAHVEKVRSRIRDRCVAPSDAMPTVSYSAAVKDLLSTVNFVGPPLTTKVNFIDRPITAEEAFEEMLDTIIDDIYTYRRPSTEQQECFDKITFAVKEAAKAIIKNTPPCQDRLTALEKLREVRMLANAAVALGGLI